MAVLCRSEAGLQGGTSCVGAALVCMCQVHGTVRRATSYQARCKGTRGTIWVSTCCVWYFCQLCPRHRGWWATRVLFELRRLPAQAPYPHNTGTGTEYLVHVCARRRGGMYSVRITHSPTHSLTEAESDQLPSHRSHRGSSVGN